MIFRNRVFKRVLILSYSNSALLMIIAIFTRRRLDLYDAVIVALILTAFIVVFFYRHILLDSLEIGDDAIIRHRMLLSDQIFPYSSIDKIFLKELEDTFGLRRASMTICQGQSRTKIQVGDLEHYEEFIKKLQEQTQTSEVRLFA